MAATRELKDALSQATTGAYGVVRLATHGEASGDDVVQADDPRLTAATDLAAHLADATDAHDASAISFAPTGTIAATDAQAAIAEVATEAAAELAAHVNDTTTAHAATAIAFTPAGSIAATTVQAAIEEVATEAAAGNLPPGGTTGQVLTKQSGTDGDADWETPGGGGGGIDELAAVLAARVYG